MEQHLEQRSDVRDKSGWQRLMLCENWFRLEKDLDEKLVMGDRGDKAEVRTAEGRREIGRRDRLTL